MTDDACGTDTAFRSAHVARIRVAIVDGTYVVDSAVIARAMVVRSVRATGDRQNTDGVSR